MKSNPNFRLKNDMRVLVMLYTSCRKSGICYLMAYFCQKCVRFELKNTEKLCSEK